MLGGVMKDNAMGRIAKKSRPSLLVLQDTGDAFLAEVKIKIGLIRHPADQGFREMNIEIIDDKMPTESSGISRNYRLRMRQKIDFCTRSTDLGCDELAGDDIAGQDESGCAVTDILKLAPLYFPRCQR